MVTTTHICTMLENIVFNYSCLLFTCSLNLTKSNIDQSTTDIKLLVADVIKNCPQTRSLMRRLHRPGPQKTSSKLELRTRSYGRGGPKLRMGPIFEFPLLKLAIQIFAKTKFWLPSMDESFKSEV